MKRSGFPSARRIAVLYIFFGGVWILLSDRLLAVLVSDPGRMTALQSYKGWAFVAASSLLLYIAIRREFRERTRAEGELRENQRSLTTLLSNLPGMVYRCLNDREWTMEMVSEGCFELTGYHPEGLIGNREISYAGLIYPDDREAVWKDVQAAVGSGRPFLLEYRIHTKSGRLKWVWEQGRGIFADDGELLALEGFITDVSDRKQAQEQAANRLRHLSALHAIDMIITASLDLNATLHVFLEQLTSHLHVDAAAVLSFDPHTRTLSYAAALGFRTDDVKRTLHRLGECTAGRAALERRTLAIANLPEDPEDHDCEQLVADEGFVAYYALPLISKGDVKGVLEVYHRSPLDPDPEWLNFLESLSLQAAIAIDNATLFRDIQRSHDELVLAYDTTLEGWARALEFRDRETKGHTDRVVEMTLRMASAMGISEEDQVHVRRGALLHDIGKMSTPDSVLFSESRLTEEERRMMERHPQYAFDLLSPIRYLRPALDIPYCHHEKWDGSGYPRGLKGEQIPLPARIFAVVDVWDALLNERRYHPAMPREDVREHLKSLAGSHFDPEVVEVFLRIEESE